MKSPANPIDRPPSWAVSFLEWFCPDELQESILGDLLEQFDQDRDHLGRRRARQLFALNVLRFFRPSLIARNQFNLPFMHTGILKNHLRVAFRSMKRYTFYSLVNLLGLSLAIAFVFLAVRFIDTELSYDRFHTRKDRIFRLTSQSRNPETGIENPASAITAIPLARDMAADFADITDFTRLGSGTATLTIKGEPYQESVSYADPGFLRMFDFPMPEGDRQTALSTPGTVVLSREKADKYFGNEPALGQLIAIRFNDTAVNLKVTGVIDPLPEKSSLTFDFLTSMDLLRAIVGEETYNSYNYGILENYVLTGGQYPAETLGRMMSEAPQVRPDETNGRSEIGLQPLTSIHLNDHVTGNARFTSPRKLYIMAALVLLVIVIAVINFITLSTSHALNRIREMGLRTSFGAVRRQLRRQMVAESFFLTLAASMAGILIAVAILPYFSTLVGIRVPASLSLRELAFILVIDLMIAWVTGSLQAFFLLKNNIRNALQGQVRIRSANAPLKKVLLVIQFALSILLISGAAGIRLQMRYVQNKDLGFEAERLLEISMNSSPDQESARQLVERFRNLALQDDRILAVSASMNSAREPWTRLMFDQEAGPPEGLFYNQVDPAYLRTMGVELVAGTGFHETDANPGDGILVNEAMVRHFGWKNPLEARIPGKEFSKPHRILGVVRDFHFSSLHQRIEPLILALDLGSISSGITGLNTYVWPSNLYQLEVRIGPGELDGALRFLEQAWKKAAPDKAFVYHFVDESLEAGYADDLRWSKVMDAAATFAVVIAWLGLLGLMRLSIQRRVREMGIRKVLGASYTGIAGLLSGQYIALIAAGAAIAFPAGWWLMQRWLASFSYRVELSPLLFLFSGFIVLLLSLGSLWLQALKAAMADPVETLKGE